MCKKLMNFFTRREKARERERERESLVTLLTSHYIDNEYISGSVVKH